MSDSVLIRCLPGFVSEPTQSEPEKMIPLSTMLPLLRYLARTIERDGLRYDRARDVVRSRDNIQPPALDPLLITTYDIAATAAGQPTTRDLMKLRLAYLDGSEKALRLPRS